MCNSVDREHIRRAYMAFKAGARLRSDDVARLFLTAGVKLSSNRLRELGRNSDRALPITSAELHLLISAWASERQQDAPAELN